jgi:hypothetical protein
MWGLRWTKRHWGRFSPSTSVSPVNHSTNFSIIIITRGWHNRPIIGRSAEWTQLDSTPPLYQLKKLVYNIPIFALMSAKCYGTLVIIRTSLPTCFLACPSQALYCPVKLLEVCEHATVATAPDRCSDTHWARDNSCRSFTQQQTAKTTH